jgi:hypothetical protein
MPFYDAPDAPNGRRWINEREFEIRHISDTLRRAAERLCGAVETFLFDSESPHYRDVDFLAWHTAAYDANKVSSGNFYNTLIYDENALSAAIAAPQVPPAERTGRADDHGIRFGYGTTERPADAEFGDPGADDTEREVGVFEPLDTSFGTQLDTVGSDRGSGVSTQLDGRDSTFTPASEFAPKPPDTDAAGEPLAPEHQDLPDEGHAEDVDQAPTVVDDDKDDN